MTTYNEIAGRRVNFLSSDPTYVDTNSNGQVWYNSSTATLKSWLPTGTFSAGGNMNTARTTLAGAGTQSAALGFGGYLIPSTNASEAYNGIAWTTTSSLNTARRALSGCGTQTAGLAFSGDTSNVGVASTATEKFNGTSWTSVPGMNTARYFYVNFVNHKKELIVDNFPAFMLFNAKFDGVNTYGVKSGKIMPINNLLLFRSCYIYVPNSSLLPPFTDTTASFTFFHLD